jgi:mono/diheme cytochrome c family protein
MQDPTIITLTAVVLLMTQLSVMCRAETPQQRGKVIAQGLCSRCHAIEKTGDSPLAAAPRFRTLDNRTDLSKLARRIREGLMTGHEDMPTFRFDRADADAMVSYIRSIQGP